MTGKNVLFIEGTQGFVNQAIVNNLENGGFGVIRVRDDIDHIVRHRLEAEMLLYYPAGSNSQIELISRYLDNLCQTEHKTLCLVGESHLLTEARSHIEKTTISSSYARPVNINRMVEDIQQIADYHNEYHRTKSILVIDDDSDFLLVISMWLQNYYKVDCVHTGTEALFYLNRMRPDLILLDYEMPGLDGYQLMEQVRSNPLTFQVPVIFLTGKSDREIVMKLLALKPDGYLLKSMKKKELLDTLERFFADSILRQNIRQFP